jgi:hypothetical protein
MNEEEKKVGQQMTMYYITEVLRMHGGNSAPIVPTMRRDE